METQDQQSPMDSNTNESNPPHTQNIENNDKVPASVSGKEPST